MIWLNLW